ATCDIDPASCVNSGLVGYWAMDEMGSTTVKDLSGNNNNGLLGGGTAAARPTWAQGVQPFSGGRPGGGALKFDGVDDWVSINSDLLGVGDITVCAWIKPTVIGSTNRRIVDNIKTEFYVDTAGTLGFISDGGGTDTYSATGIIEINKWHYVCVSRNSIALTANFYLNGVLRNGADVSLRGVSGSTYTIIGNNLVNHRQFNGSIDGVRIYNRALSEAEIRYQYNEGKPIAWWKMDEGANSSTTCNATTSNVYDYSGNGNTGALSLGGSPATSTAWTDGKFGCALQFDGTDDQVSVTSTNFNITGTITIGTWIYWTSGRANERFIMKGAVNSSGWSLYSSATNQASFVINNSYSAPVTITLNRWTYLVGVYNKSDVRIYKDGVLQGTPTVYSSDIVNIDNLVRIGYDTTGAHHFSGSLDDVRIYNYARTPDQIRQDYTAGSALHLTQ
ncbi:MAG: LamG domain-containing protein, partial [Candidatus Gribaldobacteria bacterium]|nr:LamG domain-containing protein [Candidatus Gribaldobacteria bacterium]